MNVMHRFPSNLLSFCSLLFLTQTFVLAQSTPRQVLETAVNEVLTTAYQAAPSSQTLAERLHPILDHYFSFETITRRAIGPGWKQFNPDQQKKVIALFSTVVIRTYADRYEAGERPVISYGTAAELSSDKRELPTTIDYAGKRYAVAYRLQQIEGQWRIYDVIIEGISMISNYRTQFDSLYQHGGAEAIIQSLETNLAHFSSNR